MSSKKIEEIFLKMGELSIYQSNDIQMVIQKD